MSDEVLQVIAAVAAVVLPVLIRLVWKKFNPAWLPLAAKVAYPLAVEASKRTKNTVDDTFTKFLGLLAGEAEKAGKPAPSAEEARKVFDALQAKEQK